MRMLFEISLCERFDACSFAMVGAMLASEPYAWMMKGELGSLFIENVNFTHEGLEHLCCNLLNHGTGRWRWTGLRHGSMPNGGFKEGRVLMI